MIYSIKRIADTFEIIDQTLLPHIEQYILIDNYRDMIKAIKTLQIRGAPAIGIAAAAAVYLAYIECEMRNEECEMDFESALFSAITEIEQSRPTAVNLFKATKKARELINTYLPHPCKQGQSYLPPLPRQGGVGGGVPQTKQVLSQFVDDLMTYEYTACEKMAENGFAHIPKNCNTFLTHCNTGSLATYGIGTALGVIRKIATERNIHIYVDETRPLLQGARLTMWELQKSQIPCTLITDNMAAWTIKTKGVQAIITGADRIAKNGDSANKIGTLNLAILAKHYGIPFYIVAPQTTIDDSIANGDDIIIEEREGAEVSTLYAPQTYNPAFDITPVSLISAIITDKEIFKFQ